MNDVLIKCAEENNDDKDAVVFFGRNGVRVNPFAKVEMFNDDADDSDDEATTDDEEETDSEDEDVFEFKSVEDFALLSKTEQYDYVIEIKDNEAEAEVYKMLVAYKEVVTGEKARKAIEDALAEYEE